MMCARGGSVRRFDINTSGGCHDKRCCIQIPLSAGPDVLIEDTESDFYVAISRVSIAMSEPPLTMKGTQPGERTLPCRLALTGESR